MIHRVGGKILFESGGSEAWGKLKNYSERMVSYFKFFDANK